VDDNYTTVVAEIIAAYVANNSVEKADLPRIIHDVHAAIRRLGSNEPHALLPLEAKPVPAVPVKRSVTPNFIVCLEDGKKFQALKRHLGVVYNLTPDEYRAKWNLPGDYPMVAPNYAARRSSIAKNMGLGQTKGKAVADKASAPMLKKTSVER
jgi:predicted transcriptional regulator